MFDIAISFNQKLACLSQSTCTLLHYFYQRIPAHKNAILVVKYHLHFMITIHYQEISFATEHGFYVGSTNFRKYQFLQQL